MNTVKNNTNVVNMFTLAERTSSQETFYDPGVGTGGWEYEEESGFLKAKSAGLALDENLVKTIPGNHDDKIHESYDGFWKFRGSRKRKIPEGALIHKSVFDRMNNPANKYKPKNLPEDYTIVE